MARSCLLLPLVRRRSAQRQHDAHRRRSSSTETRSRRCHRIGEEVLLGQRHAQVAARSRPSSADLDDACPGTRRRAPSPAIAPRRHALAVEAAELELVGAHRDQAAPGAVMTLWPPMKRATNSVAGWLKMSRGVPACSIRPLFITTIEIGQRHRLVLAVGDVDEGDAELLLQPLQLGAHLDAQERVERRQRLVEQQDLRLGDQRARERDALLLAARQLRRQPLRRSRPWRRGAACRAPWRGASSCRRPPSSG